MKVERRIQKDVPDLGERIWRARKLDKRPLTEIAATAGMSLQNWYSIEKGEIKVLPESTLRKIETALGINLGVTFDFNDVIFEDEEG
ncbi:helix-turn-helix transcriptional regulator [Nostoc flagelliforme FACHB-838]|uniref:Helix-turn-helix transcriptional regulator n=1 Tax=Nostoc flagelliforme FACHB-838 TaxID=2692904 RepID=A0ABR8E5S5_9NOSO|nr:helix-turn-helix transcriptional regulator [Nostoc flagelliforme]MBD2535949.1 helix-turn-helix transcriptional regulator [Nostoc flagelliforme FACHB-838]